MKGDQGLSREVADAAAVRELMRDVGREDVSSPAWGSPRRCGQCLAARRDVFALRGRSPFDGCSVVMPQGRELNAQQGLRTMPEELPVLPDPVDVGDIEELVDRYAPDIRPVLNASSRLAPYVSSLLVAGYAGVIQAYVLFGESYLAHGATLALAAVFAVTGLAVGEPATRYLHRNRLLACSVARGRGALGDPRGHLSALPGRDSGSTGAHHGAGLRVVRGAATPEDAYEQASRSESYWRERLSQDPNSDVNAGQLATAERLSAKFSEALGELDKRSDVLVRFFNDCEAKLSVLESSIRDVVESRRLSELSDKADDIIVDAGATLASIARQFVAEAAQVGEALGALERLQIKESAGSVPLERIEAVADRIIASSEQEAAALAGLVSTLAPGGDGAGE